MPAVIRSRAGTWKLTPRPGENLLYAGLEAGAPLPYECATGTCGTCRARVKSGQTQDLWPSAPGKAKLDPAAGDVLLCQCLAEGDCEVLIPGNPLHKLEHRLKPGWGKGQLRLLRSLNDDVRLFELSSEACPDYLAGQFVSIHLPGVDGFRAYSMTSFQPGTGQLHFLLKRQAGGAFTNICFDRDFESAPVEFFGPLGGAVFLPEEGHDIAAVAGGSGIAGLLSILEQAERLRYFDERRGWLFFGVRTLAEAFYLNELQALARRNPNLAVVLALSEEAPPAEFPFPDLAVAGGLVHQVARQYLMSEPQDAGRPDNRLAFVAGPPPMVDQTLRTLLTDLQFPAERIRYDKYA